MTRAIDRQLYLKRLRAIAERREREAAIVRNGDNTAHGDKIACALDDDRFALNWAIRELEERDKEGHWTWPR